MPGRRGTLVLACAAALAVAPAADAFAQEVQPTTTLAPTSSVGVAEPQITSQTSAQDTPTTATPAAATPATTTAPTTSGNGRGLRLILVVLGAIVLAALALWAFARWWAWEPPWAARWRHATAEAGWRASAAWAEFTDWLRLGR
jgi:hypothetical protein